jgi:hypothetical protein
MLMAEPGGGLDVVSALALTGADTAGLIVRGKEPLTLGDVTVPLPNAIVVKQISN